MFMAYMFHNSALVALIIPLYGIIKYNKKVLFFLITTIVAVIIIIMKMDLMTVLDFVLEGEYLGKGVSDIGNIYAKSDKLGVQDVKIGFVMLFRVVAIFIVVLYYIIKKKDVYFGGISLTYLLFLVSSFTFPIMFRFGSYFEVPFYVVLSSVVIEYPMGRLYQIRSLFYIGAFIFYSIFPCSEYMMKYPGSKYRYIDQYYPYHSVLDPKVEEKIDQNKINFFKWL